MILTMTLTDFELFSSNELLHWMFTSMCTCVLAQGGPVIDGPNKQRSKVR